MSVAFSLSHQHRLARWLSNALLIGGVVYFSWLIARITWLFLWTPEPLPGLTGSDTSSIDVRSSRSLAAFHLFGRPPVEEALPETVTREAPETNLKLRLEGVLVSEDRSSSGAIVAGTRTPASWFRIGDTLPGNAELIGVEPHRILIRRNGEVEALTFEDAKSEEQPIAKAQKPELDLSSPDAFVADARQKLLEEGAAALARFGLRPVSSGAASGYEYDGSNPMLSAMNLKEGDIVTSINGHRLGDPAVDAGLLEEWQSQGQISVVVRRDGARFTINYSLPGQGR